MNGDDSLYLNHDFQGSGEQASVVMKFTQKRWHVVDQIGSPVRHLCA